jgi:MerR family transcriptional regulator, light-induced transcriptional regulator
MTAPHPFAAPYLAAALSGSRLKARSVVDQALAAGVDIRAIYLHIFQPALREVGCLWQENRISVADEHVATAITQALMAQLHGQTSTGVRGSRGSMIAACMDSERHEVGLRMVCDLVEREGWDTTFLGAGVPTESLVEMVRERRPDALAFSVSLAPHLSRLARTIAMLRERMGDATPVIVVGGRPFLDEPELAATVGADIVAADADDAVVQLRERFGE